MAEMRASLRIRTGGSPSESAASQASRAGFACPSTISRRSVCSFSLTPHLPTATAARGPPALVMTHPATASTGEPIARDRNLAQSSAECNGPIDPSG